MKAPTYTTQGLIKGLTLKVTIKQNITTPIRLKLGMFLIKSAAYVIGCGIEIEEKCSE